MKSVLVIGALVVALLGAAFAPAAAQSVDELADLAAYYPADTIAFFSVRTDDAFVDEFDALIDRVAGQLPAGTVPPFSLRDTFDQGLQQMYGSEATFENTIRPWLGDNVSLGVIGTEETMPGSMGSADAPVLLVMEITDREAALEFFTGTYAQNGVEVSTEERGDYTYIVPERPSNAFLAFGDDVLMLASAEDIIPFNSDFLSFAANEDVQAALALLPSSDYDAIAALNLADVVEASFELAMEDAAGNENIEVLQGMQPLFENYPAQAIGYRLIDGRSLTLDFVQTAVDYSMLPAGLMGDIGTVLNAEPIDPAFAANIPADAPFFIQGTNLGSTIDYAFTAITLAAEMGLEMRSASPMRDDVPEMLQDMSAADMRAFLDMSFSGVTNLNLFEDVLPYINGNYALFGRLVPSESLGSTLDAAMLIEVTDAEATQNMYDSLLTALGRYEADFEVEDGVIVLPGALRAFISDMMGQRLRQEPVFDVLVGMNESLMVAGTRNAVEFALNPASPTMDDDADFQAASAAFLPDAQSVFYMGFPAIRSMVNQMAAGVEANTTASLEVEQLNVLLNLFSSLSISTAIHDDGATVGRLVLTLSE